MTASGLRGLSATSKLVAAALASCLLWAHQARADSVEYRYDDLGRVIEAINSTSQQATIYAYDAAGNITEVRNVALSAVAIAGFTPARGPVGTSVKIAGSGFSTTPSANTVTFNGQAATVTAATVTQLTVTVPGGATTGRIVVTNSSGTDTSRADFVVTATSGLPTITSFSPTLGTLGTSVSVTGTNFWPTAGSNKLLFNQTAANVASIAGTTGLSTAVPANATSGKLRVVTPAGSAFSSSDFFIVPSGFAAADVAVTGRMTLDTSAPVSLGSSGKIALQVFDGAAGQYLTLAITNNNISSAALSVLTPSGATLVSQTVTPSTPAVQLPKLPQTGTYTIVVDPASANTGSMTLTLYGPVTGVLTSSDLPFTASPAGRRVLLTYTGTANTWRTLTMSAVTLSGTVTLFSPTGDALLSRPTANGIMDPHLPIAGTYTVLIDPNGAVSGSVTVRMTAATVYVNNYTISPPHVHSFKAGALAGQYMHLVVYGFARNATESISVSITSPVGTPAGSATIPINRSIAPACFACDYEGSAVFDFGRMPRSGAYTVTTTRARTGGLGDPYTPLEVSYYLPQPVPTALPVNGGTVGVGVSRGQGVLLTFSANAGQSVTVTANVAGQPIQGATLRLIGPSGAQIGSTATLNGTEILNCNAFGCLPTGNYNGSATIGPSGALSETGTYSVIVTQVNAGYGTFTFGLSADNDKDPAAFVFSDVTGATRNTVYTSNQITVAGINTASPVSVVGGEYSKNGAAFTTGTTTAVATDLFRVRHTSSSQFGATKFTTLTIGGQSDTFSTKTEPEDASPNAFTFNDVTGVPVNTVQTSTTITVGGINTTVPVAITGGEYSKNGAVFTSAAGSAVLGDTFSVRHTSSPSNSSQVNTTLTIGTASDTFSSTTEDDRDPDPFTFVDVTNVPRSTVQTSNTITISGLSTSVSVNINGGGSYSKNGGPYTQGASGTATNGDTFHVRHTSSSSYNTPVNTTLTVGLRSDTFTTTTEQQDTTPDQFSFTDVTGVSTSSVQTSNVVTVTGINSSASVSVVGGSYSKNGGAFVTTSGTASTGDTFQVRHTASSSFSTPTNTTLTIGGISDTFTSTTEAADTTPDPFTFNDVSGATRNTLYTSNQVTISGLGVSVPVSVTGGDYSRNGGPYTTAAGTTFNGDTFVVRHISSGSFSATASAILTIGNGSEAFSSTTEAEDLIPNAFSFTDVTGVTRSSQQVSNVITVTGINSQASISVSGGEYSKNSGAYTSAAGTVVAGDNIQVRHTSSASYATAVNSTVTIGGVSDTFSSTTEADGNPDAFTFTDTSGVGRGAQQTSNAITISGITTSVPVSVVGGEYSKNAGAYTTAAGTAISGDSFRVRHVSATSFSSSTSTTLTVGPVSDTFTSITELEDTAPNQFTFTDVTGVLPASQQTSAAVAISGINTSVPISVIGGEYQIVGVAGWTTASGTIAVSQQVQVRHTAATATGTQTNTKVTIGGVSDTFSSTTSGVGSGPSPFSFTDTNGVARSSLQTSNEVTIAGLTGAGAVTVSGGEYSKNGAAFTTAGGTAVSGDRFRLRHTASASYGSSVHTMLTVGGNSGAFTSTTETRDVYPNSFTFADLSNAPLNTEQTSDLVTVAGVNAAVTVTVAGGTYSKNGAGYTSASGTAVAGDTFRVRHTSAATPATTVTTSLSVGTASDAFSSTTESPDAAPNAFLFEDFANAARNTSMTSNVVTVAGINTAAPVSISGGEYSKNGSSYTAGAGSVVAGDTVQVRHTSAAAYNTAVNTTLTIGGISDTFSSTTAADQQPDAFMFVDISEVDTSAVQVSNEILVSGISSAVSLSVTGGEYSKNSAAFTSVAGSASSGDRIRVRHTSAATTGTSTNTTLSVGETSDTFTSTTNAGDTTPNPFTFVDQTNVGRNSVRTSNVITISGINASTSVTVVGGTYSKNGGAYTSAAGTAVAGDTFTVQHTSSPGFLSDTNTTLTVGGVSDTFTSTTRDEFGGGCGGNPCP